MTLNPTHEPAPSPWRLLLVGLAFLLGIFAIGYLGFVFYLDELYPSSPPSSPPPLGAPIDARAERLVIVVLDAIREDIFSDPEAMPNMVRIAEKGRKGVSMTQTVTMTLLSVVNFGTGQTPGLGWSVHNFEAESFRDESVFYWTHAHGLKTAFFGDAAWAQLYGRYAQQELTFSDEGMYAEEDGLLSVHDRQAIAAADEALADPDAFDVIVLHVTSTDHAGHKAGALTRDEQGALTLYGQTAKETDALVGALFDRHYHDGDTWLFTADHGMTDDGNHGGGDEVARRAPFALVGRGVKLAPPDTEPAFISLNAWAATFSTLLGVPVPRTAEQPAALSLLELTEEEQSAVLFAHAQRRREFVDGVRLALGVEQAAIWQSEDPSEAIQEANAFLFELRQHRRYLFGLGVALGLALNIIALVLLFPLGLQREPNKPAASKLVLVGTALLWLLLVSLPLIFDHWLFRIVAVLGQATDSWWNIGRALLYLLGISGLIVLTARFLMKYKGPHAEALQKGAAWLFFAVSVLAFGQMVIKWPYGPLSQAYIALFIWLGLVSGYFALRRRHLRWRWLLGSAAFAAMAVLVLALERKNLQLIAETELSCVLGSTLPALGVLALSTAIMWREQR
ncbi:MAG: alkaline phosphatase family protein, partial [Myxococcota bacterium]|nr:alkaline phosphatase family protein [Myxococcota bacterium]